MEFNYFDLVASVIILFLGLKGVMNGFFKELFGLVGIIGGIFLASRIGDSVGQKLSDLIFNFQNEAGINFSGFLITLTTFWMLMLMVGYVFKKLSSLSGLGIIDKILGFAFGASKFFLIASIIAYATYSIKAIRSGLDSASNNSIIFPIMVETGGYIMKIDHTGISDSINQGIDETKQEILDKIDEEVTSATQKKLQEIRDKTEEEY
jgi:membrane protein required for colicin V production